MGESRMGRKICGESREHRHEKKCACGDEKPKPLLQLRKVAAVSENDANRNCERDEIETGDENNMQPADAIDREKCNHDESGEDRQNSRSQTVRKECAPTEWQLRCNIGTDCGDADPPAGSRQIDDINPKRNDDC